MQDRGAVATHATPDAASPLPPVSRPEHGTSDSPLPPGSNTSRSHPPLASVLPGWLYALTPVVLGLFVLIAHVPSLEAGFVFWDDDAIVLNNPYIRGLTGDHLAWMFTTATAGHYQPLTWISYAWDYHCWGLYDTGYHLTNVLLHSATAVAFFFLVRRLLAVGMNLPRRCRDSALIGAAAVGCLLFAVHPLRAESVTWVVGRRDVLSGAFFVLSILAYLRYVDAARAGQHDGQFAPGTVRPAATRDTWPGRLAACWYVASLLACVLSLSAKAGAMTIAPVLVVLDVFPLRRLQRGAASSGETVAPPTTLGRLIVEKLPFLVLGAAAGVTALWAQQAGGALESIERHGWGGRAAQACHGLVFYPLKTILPIGLGPLYELPEGDGLLNARLVVNFAVILVVAVACVKWRRRIPGVVAAVAVYVLLIGPVLGVAQSGRQLVADRYSYLSCMPFAVLFGAGVLLFSGGRRRGPLANRAQVAAFTVVVLAALVIALKVSSDGQQSVWRDRWTLWQRGLEISPESPIARVNYADALASRALAFTDPTRAAEEYARAIEHYLHALRLRPDDVIAWHHLAEVQRRSGRNHEAITSYIETLRRDPNRRGAHLPLAKLLLQAGRPALAIRTLVDGAERTPGEWEMIRYLAEVLATFPDTRIRDGRQAVVWARRAAESRGRPDPEILLTLSWAHEAAGEHAEAIAAAEAALALLHPENDLRLHRRILRELGDLRRDVPIPRENQR
jgi:tetratricopeptide (TPR) repeat protein